MGSIVLWVGMSILGFNAIGIGMAVGYWIFLQQGQTERWNEGQGSSHSLAQRPVG